MKKSFLKLMLVLSCFTGVGTTQGQTWTENDKLVSGNRQVNGEFSSQGEGVGISGDYAVVGAPRESYGGFSGAGRAYVYKKDANCNWVLNQTINPPVPTTGDYFGFAVSMDNGFMVISSRNEDEDASETTTVNNAGSAYIYRNIGGVWTLMQKIVASDREVGGAFGHDLDLSGRRIIVGAWGDDQGSGAPYVINSGAAYIFEFNGTTWNQVQKLVASDRQAHDWFGVSVAIYGNNAIVGAHSEDHDAGGGSMLTNSGSAYMFERSGGTWSEIQKVTSSDRGTYEYFGMQVDMHGSYAIVGCKSDYQDENGLNSMTAAGSAFVFKKSSGTWVIDQKLDASDRTAGDRFGHSVALGKEFAVVGAYIESHDELGGNYMGAAGSAYIFRLSSSGWSQMQKVVPNDRASQDRFGSSAAIWDDKVIIGALYEDEDDAAIPTNTLLSAGSAYMFEINTPASTPTVTASSASVCSGGTVTLSASGSLGDAANWQWYSGSCGGTPIGTGSSITVSQTSTTTYYVNGVGGCVSPGACGSITINTSAPSWHQTTMNANGGDHNNDVAVDANNNVYVTGTFINQTVLDGGNNPNYVMNTGVGSQVASYVAKYDACGDLIWVAHTKGSKDNYSNSIALDENDEVVYIAGDYVSNVIFTTSSGCVSTQINAPGSSTGYVAAFKMANGCVISVDPVVANTSTKASAIAVNKSTGDIYVGGNESPNTSGSPYTSYIFKYSPTGAGIGGLITSITSNNFGLYNNEVNDLDFDEIDEMLWVIGDYEKSVNFTPGNLLTAATGTVQDAYLLAYEDNGAFFSTVYNKIGNATYFMSGQGVAVDPNSGVPFMTGGYRGGIGDPFDFGALNSLPTLSGYSAYTASFDLGSSGWARYYNSPGGTADGTAVTHDGSRAYFAGTFNRTSVDVQGIGSYPYSVIGTPLMNNHTIVACYENNGSGVWANVTEDPSSNSAIHNAKGIAAGGSNHVFVAGSYRGRIDYWYSTGAPVLSSSGSGTNGYTIRVAKTGGNMFKTGGVENQVVDAEIVTEITAYPNPTNGNLTLQIDGFNAEKEYEGLLMNAMGQVVLSKTLTSPTTNWNLSDFSTGIYILLITDGVESQTIRISKNN